MTLIGDRTQGRRRSRLKWVVLGAVIFGALSLLVGRVFLGEVVRYRGQEMAPTLQDGDWLLIEDQDRVAVDDIVLVQASPRAVIRRVVLTSSQKIPPQKRPKSQRTEEPQPTLVPLNQVFLSCERPVHCEGLPAQGLTPITAIRGTVTGRWAFPL